MSFELATYVSPVQTLVPTMLTVTLAELHTVGAGRQLFPFRRVRCTRHAVGIVHTEDNASRVRRVHCFRLAAGAEYAEGLVRRDRHEL